MVEMVVVLGIVALGMVVLGSLFVWQSSYVAKELGFIEGEAAHNASMEKLSRDVRTGRSFTDSYDTFTAGSSTLIIETPLLGDEDHETEFDYIVYYVDASSTLRRKVIASSQSQRVSHDRAVNASLVSLQFVPDAGTFAASGAVETRIETSVEVRGTTHTLRDLLTLGLRNR